MRTQDSGNALDNQGRWWKKIFRTTAMANIDVNRIGSLYSFHRHEAN